MLLSHRPLSQRKGQMNAPGVVSHSVRTMFIRSSILRTIEGRLELRLCSILNPVKKVRTNSAREPAFIFGRSTSIFLAMSCFSLLLLRVMMPRASAGNIGNSRMELTAKHPFCPSMLHGPILRNRSMLFQPKGSVVSSPFFSRLSRNTEGSAQTDPPSPRTRSRDRIYSHRSLVPVREGSHQQTRASKRPAAPSLGPLSG